MKKKSGKAKKNPVLTRVTGKGYMNKSLSNYRKQLKSFGGRNNNGRKR